MSNEDDQIWADLADYARLPFEEARMLPPTAYVSPAILAEEHRRIFANEWICVGRAADLPSRGDYVTSEISSAAGDSRSIIVVRGDDGAITALDNSCAHRGSPLLHGCGNESRITCPYHAWVYRLDGQLIGAPYMNRTVDSSGKVFDAAAYHLPQLRLEEWEGFLFVTQDPDVPSLHSRLAGLTDVAGRYRMAGYVPVHRQVEVWDANWKLLSENFVDAYHVFKVHKNTFFKDGDKTSDITMHVGTDHFAHFTVCLGTDTSSDLAHSTNTSLIGEWRHTLVIAAAFPTLLMQLQPDWLWYMQLTPVGVDRVRVRWDMSVAPEVLADQSDVDAYVADLLDLANRVNAEDRPVVEGVARTVRHGMPRGPLSYLERNVYDFDRYIARALGKAGR